MDCSELRQLLNEYLDAEANGVNPDVLLEQLHQGKYCFDEIEFQQILRKVIQKKIRYTLSHQAREMVRQCTSAGQ